MILSDTHIHLYAEEFNGDRKELIQKAIENGVSRFFLPNIDSTTLSALLNLQQQFPANCFPMMGLHPCYVNEGYKKELATVEKQLTLGNYCGIGEIGMDLYWDKTFVKQQEAAFEKQIAWASELNLPVSIHSRNATAETISLLKKNSHLKVRGVFHCFSGTLEQAEQVIEMGFYLGIGGVITYKKSGLDNIIQNIDLKHIVLETDAPYLPPTPHRGKRNIPEYLHLISQKIAEVKNISLEETASITTSNSRLIFNR
jgi:TatD DNase family protein